MSLETCYAAMDGDLESVRARLMTDERITKFVKIFLSDTSFANLHAALDEGNDQDAFRAAHTMKGVSRDLGFTPLYEVSCELSEALRLDDDGNQGDPASVPALLERFDEAYNRTVDAIGLI